MVKRQIVPLSAAANDSFFFLFAPSLCFLLFHLQHCSYRLLVLISPDLSGPRLILLPSVPRHSPSVFFSLPSINFFLLPHLLSFPIQYFPPLSSPRRTHIHTHPHICSLLLPISGVGNTLPSPAGCVSLLSTWGRVDLLQPPSGITTTSPPFTCAVSYPAPHIFNRNQHQSRAIVLDLINNPSSH